MESLEFFLASDGILWIIAINSEAVEGPKIWGKAIPRLSLSVSGFLLFRQNLGTHGPLGQPSRRLCTFDCKFWYRHSDDERFWFEWRSFPVKNRSYKLSSKYYFIFTKFLIILTLRIEIFHVKTIFSKNFTAHQN